MYSSSHATSSLLYVLLSLPAPSFPLTTKTPSCPIHYLSNTWLALCTDAYLSHVIFCLEHFSLSIPVRIVSVVSLSVYELNKKSHTISWGAFTSTMKFVETLWGVRTCFKKYEKARVCEGESSKWPLAGCRPHRLWWRLLWQQPKVQTKANTGKRLGETEILFYISTRNHPCRSLFFLFTVKIHL